MDGRGVVTTYTRADPESRVTQVAYDTTRAPSVSPLGPTVFQYDHFGRLTQMQDATGITAYTAYDDLGELLGETRSFTNGPQNQALAWAHYPDGSLKSLATPTALTNPLTINGGAFTDAYDRAGRLTGVTVPFPGGSLTHTYQNNGWPKETDNLQMPGATLPSTRTFYAFDGRGFLTGLNNYQYDPTSGYDAFSSSFTRMTYDAAGNRLGETSDIPAEGSAPDASRKLTFGYDENNSSATANRDVLESEISGPYGSGSGAYHDSYSNGFGADAAYNLINFSLDGSSQGMSPNADNQDTHFTFDGDGNPASYQGATLTFDPEDRLTMITGGGMAGPFTAGYDGDGLRAWKRGTLPGTSSAVTTYFLYDGGHPVLEETYNASTGAASLSAVNLWGADGWRARYSPGGQFYAFSFDPQGNVIQRQNSGNVLGYTYDTASYEAYGHRGADYDTGGMTPAPVQSPAGFGGQFGYYTDPETGNATAPGTGLLCLTHRYYDPGTGRFLNRDPSGYSGGVNLYGFAGDNPVNGQDPSGPSW